MIFLKKILFWEIIASAVCLLMCSCSSGKTPGSGSESVPATSQPFTERKVESADGTYVFDKAGLLSQVDLKACNDYAGWLHDEKLINSAVVTVSELNGKTPYDYAADQFEEIYEGRGSGLVILINNATNEDIVYRTGSCFTSISQSSEDNAIYWATKEIIGNNYRNGIMRLLQLGELCNSHFIDNAQIFSYEDIKRFEKSLSDIKEDVCMIATRNGSKTSNEDILKGYYQRKCKDGKGIMLMLDTESGSVTAYSAEKLPSKLEKAMKEVNEFSAKGDNTGAVNRIIEVFEK